MEARFLFFGGVLLDPEICGGDPFVEVTEFDRIERGGFAFGDLGEGIEVGHLDESGDHLKVGVIVIAFGGELAKSIDAGFIWGGVFLVLDALMIAIELVEEFDDSFFSDVEIDWRVGFCANHEEAKDLGGEEIGHIAGTGADAFGGGHFGSADEKEFVWDAEWGFDAVDGAEAGFADIAGAASGGVIFAGAFDGDGKSDEFGNPLKFPGEFAASVEGGDAPLVSASASEVELGVDDLGGEAAVVD